MEQFENQRLATGSKRRPHINNDSPKAKAGRAMPAVSLVSAPDPQSIPLCGPVKPQLSLPEKARSRETMR